MTRHHRFLARLVPSIAGVVLAGLLIHAGAAAQDAPKKIAILPFAVPEGRRLVIETIACEATVPAGQRVRARFVTLVNGGGTVAGLALHVGLEATTGVIVPAATIGHLALLERGGHRGHALGHDRRGV